MTPTKSNSTAEMKASTKLIISGVLTAVTVVLAGELFDALGVLYGPAQAGLSGAAGLIGSARLLAAS